MRQAPYLLGFELPPGRRVAVEQWQSRMQHAFLDIGLQARFAAVEPPGIVLDDLWDRREPTAQAALQVCVHHLRLHEIFHEVLGDVDGLGTFRDEPATGVDLGLHRRSVVLVHRRQRLHVMIEGLLVLDHGQFRGQRAVEVHDEQLLVEAVVVVGIVPAQRLRRHHAFLVQVGHEFHRLNRRFADLRVVGVQLAIRGDDAFAAIGDQKMPEHVIAVVRTNRGDLQAKRINVAHALGAQWLLGLLEIGPYTIPILRDFRHLQAGLFHQVAPDVERRRALLDRAQVVAALLGRLVEEGGAQLRGFREVRLAR